MSRQRYPVLLPRTSGGEKKKTYPNETSGLVATRLENASTSRQKYIFYQQTYNLSVSPIVMLT